MSQIGITVQIAVQELTAERQYEKRRVAQAIVDGGVEKQAARFLDVQRVGLVVVIADSKSSRPSPLMSSQAAPIAACGRPEPSHATPAATA